MLELVGVHLFSQVVTMFLMQEFATTGVTHVCALLLIEQGKTLLHMCVEFWLLEQFLFS